MIFVAIVLQILFQLFCAGLILLAFLRSKKTVYLFAAIAFAIMSFRRVIAFITALTTQQAEVLDTVILPLAVTMLLAPFAYFIYDNEKRSD